MLFLFPMANLLKPFSLLLILLAGNLSVLKIAAQEVYQLHIYPVDDDSDFVKQELQLQTKFSSEADCRMYVATLPATLKNKGYITANIDSVRFDSLHAYLYLYTGNKYQWALLDVSGVETSLLRDVGWQAQSIAQKPVDMLMIENWQQRILNQLENTGYPFARVFLDSFKLVDGTAYAQLKVDKGPLYKIDSIRVYGDVKISNEYLQRYLGIENGSIYNKAKLDKVSIRIAALGFVDEEQAPRITMLGTGAVLNVYLKSRRNSQVNGLIGFLPGNEQAGEKKLLVTGEANILLKNALAAGETIGLNWQQLQVKSPRLHLLYQHPFILRSPFGLDFNFDMFRKDSTFLNVNFQIGARYRLNDQQEGKIFIQRFITIVNGINTPMVLLTKSLPQEADVSALNIGIDYLVNSTNHRFNPVKGNVFNLIVALGNKKIKKNNEVLELKDPGNPSFDFASLYDTVKLNTYQLRSTATAAKYFPLGRQSTLKTSVSAGYLYSENIFRNELFQIGGFRLLRGFDEESQYLSQYAIGSVEYRYLVGVNSYFYAFFDGGYGKNNSQSIKENYTYAGTGAGLALETKVGIFNIALAAGKRNDTPFNLRQSKIHFGFLNFF